MFPIAGGALGMLLALFVFTGMLPGHRMNKENVAWWFLAIVCLVAWGVVVAVRFGLVPLDPSISGLLTGWDLDKLKILGVYLVIVNIFTFVVFVRDKRAAQRGNNFGKRTPAAFLLGLCLIGGSVGGMIAMRAVRHKTMKWYFVWGLPLFIVLDVVLVLFAHMGGVI